MEAQPQGWLARLGDSFDSEADLADLYGIATREDGVPPGYERPHMRDEMLRRLEIWKRRA